MLHRVTPNNAGPVDSVRTDEKGRFAFHFVPDSGALYLVSAQYGGIAYFSPPAGANQASPPPAADIVVFDTTSADVPLRLQGRHLVVSKPNERGVRSVIDVLEIENDTMVTRVAVGDERPTFSVLVPEGAVNTRASQGDGSDAPLKMKEGRVQLYNALSPGLRQVVLTYDLPSAVFPVKLPLERAVGVFEVLMEDTTSTVAGPKLASKGVVSVDGRSFARFMAQDTPPNGVVQLSVPSPSVAARVPKWLLPLVLALAALGTAVWVTRRPADQRDTLPAAPSTLAGRDSAPAAARAIALDEAQLLANAAASVDALIATRNGDMLTDALREYRNVLKSRLRDVLARRSNGS